MARDQPSILFVYPRFNDARDPSAGGAENRTAHLMCEASQAFDVSLLQVEPVSSFEGETPYTNTFFRRLTPAFLTDLNPFYWIALYRHLRSNEYDIVQVESLGGILMAILLTSLFAPESSVIYGSHNVEAERVASALNPDLPLYKRVGAPVVVPFLERIAVSYSDYVIAVSDNDRATFHQRYDVPLSKLVTVRSGTEPVNLDDLEDRDTVRSRYGLDEDDVALVFHGTYENYANREALELIRSQVVSGLGDPIKVFVAGSGMPEFEEDSIVSIGFVPDLNSFLNAMDVAIVPLTSGGGTKLKIFDYMAMGLPIVATKKAMEGIDIDPGVDAIVVDSVGSDFVDAVRQIARDPLRRRELGRRTLELAEEEYSWSRIGERLRAVYGEMLDCR